MTPLLVFREVSGYEPHAKEEAAQEEGGSPDANETAFSVVQQIIRRTQGAPAKKPARPRAPKKP